MAKLVLELVDEDVERLPASAVGVAIVEAAKSEGRSYVIVESGPLDSRPLDDHLSDLWAQAKPLIDETISAGILPVACVLRVIQYVRPDDEHEPGFGLHPPWIAALAKLNGFLDADLYVQH